MTLKPLFFIMKRNIHKSKVQFKQIKLTNVGGKSVSSQQWLTRQIKDPYVEKAKMLNYRCRSAFKLLEIDDKYRILKPGQMVVDCGAAPGSWTQIAITRVNSDMNLTDKPKGMVIAVDRTHIYPLEHVYLLGNSDFTQTETQEKIKTLLNNNAIDVVLSDMAPNATGIKDMDQENIMKLCYSVLQFAVQLSTVDGTLLVKLWQGSGAKQLENDLARFYKNVKFIKPNSSRSDSAEIFLLARQFKGLKLK